MTIAAMALWFGLGAAVGAAGYRSLEWTVARLEPGRGGAAWILLGTVLRWTAAAALLVFALHAGAAAGLAAAAGLILTGRLMLARGIGRL